MHPYGLNLDEWIKWWPNGSLFSRLRFFEGTQPSPHFQRRAELAKMHVSGWALASNRPGYLLKKLQPRFASCCSLTSRTCAARTVALASAHPETCIFSQFSSPLEVGAELSALKNSGAAK